MAYPYSDNMYSMDDDSDDGGPVRPDDDTQSLDENQALSPSDGYFSSHPTCTTNSSGPPPPLGPASQSPNTHQLPDVWVEDPSLQLGGTAESKAREAAQERAEADAAANRPLSPPPHTHPPPQSYSAPSQSATTITTTTTTTSTYSPSQAAGSASSGRPTGNHTQQRHRYTPSPPPSSSSSSSSPQMPVSHNNSNNTGLSTPGIYSQRSSILVPAEAPPAYTPSPTSTSTSPLSSSSSSSSPTFSRNYRTFAMGRRSSEETRGLLDGGGEPQSMGGDDLGDVVAPAWREGVRRRLPPCNWRNCRVLALCVVLFLVATGFLVTSIQVISHGNSQLPLAENPGDSPLGPMDPGRYPHFDKDLVFANRACKGPEHRYPRQQFPVAFSAGRNLSVVQKTDKSYEGDNRRGVQVSGDVVVRRQGGESPSITVEAVSNHEGISVGVEFDEDSQSLVLTTPKSIYWADKSSFPCLSIRATVWVPEGATLDSLRVEAVHLGIKLLDNLSIQVSGTTRLYSTTGKVVAATTGSEDNDTLMHEGAPSFFILSSRTIEVQTVSASISGSWPLYDLLYLKSVSGSISAGVEPKTAARNNPKPADLVLESVSGTIQFWEPVHRALGALDRQQRGLAVARGAEDIIPPRDYRVSVQSTSGTIKGAAAFTYTARFKSVSGSISLDLLPVLADITKDTNCELKTETRSGSTTVEVLEPIWADDIIHGAGRYVDTLNPPPSPGAPATLPPPVPVGNRDPYQLVPVTVPRPAAVALGRVPDGSSTERQQVAESLLRVLHSSHETTSGTIRLAYPAAWAGQVRLRSLSGRLSVAGKDVRIVKSGREFPGVEDVIIAEKGKYKAGEARSVVAAFSTSASVELKFPE